MKQFSSVLWNIENCLAGYPGSAADYRDGIRYAVRSLAQPVYGHRFERYLAPRDNLKTKQ
jgi:hypothetical protein